MVTAMLLPEQMHKARDVCIKAGLDAKLVERVFGNQRAPDPSSNFGPTFLLFMSIGGLLTQPNNLSSTDAEELAEIGIQRSCA